MTGLVRTLIPPSDSAARGIILLVHREAATSLRMACAGRVRAKFINRAANLLTSMSAGCPEVRRRACCSEPLGLRAQSPSGGPVWKCDRSRPRPHPPQRGTTTDRPSLRDSSVSGLVTTRSLSALLRGPRDSSTTPTKTDPHEPHPDDNPLVRPFQCSTRAALEAAGAVIMRASASRADVLSQCKRTASPQRQAHIEPGLDRATLPAGCLDQQPLRGSRPPGEPRPGYPGF